MTHATLLEWNIFIIRVTFMHRHIHLGCLASLSFSGETTTLSYPIHPRPFPGNRSTLSFLLLYSPRQALRASSTTRGSIIDIFHTPDESVNLVTPLVNAHYQRHNTHDEPHMGSHNTGS